MWKGLCAIADAVQLEVDGKTIGDSTGKVLGDGEGIADAPVVEAREVVRVWKGDGSDDLELCGVDGGGCAAEGPGGEGGGLVPVVGGVEEEGDAGLGGGAQLLGGGGDARGERIGTHVAREVLVELRERHDGQHARGHGCRGVGVDGDGWMAMGGWRWG